MANGAIRTIEATLLWWVSRVFRKPRLALGVVSSLALVGLVLAANDLQVNTDASDMIDPNLPYRVAEREFDAAFPELDDIILVLVRGRSADETDSFTAALTRTLEEKMDGIRTVYAPTTHPFFARNGLLLMSEEDLEDQLNRLTKASPVIEALNRDQSADTLFNALASRSALAREADETDIDAGFLDPVYEEVGAVIEARLSGAPRPLSWQRLFTTGDEANTVHQQVVAVSPELNFTTLQPAKEAIATIRQTADGILNQGDWAGIEYGVTGTPALRAEELRSVSNGIGLSMALSFLAVAILLWLALRSVGMVATALFTLVLTLAITAGFAALTVGQLNLVSVAFAVLLIGLGIDFAIHFALHIIETARTGTPARHSVQSTVREVGGALALCAPTTALAFFAFVPTQFVGMAQLGIISGAGVLVAFGVAITVIPAAAALLPPTRSRPGPKSRSRLAELTVGWSGRALALGTMVLAVVALPLLTQVRFNADPMQLRDPKTPSVQTFEKLFDDTRTNPYRLNVLVNTDAEVSELSAKLEALPQVQRVIALQDFIPDDQDIKLELIEIAGTSLEFALRPPETQSANPTAEAQAGQGLQRLRDELGASAQSGSAKALLARLEQLAAAIETDADVLSGLEGDFFRFWSFQMARLRAQLSPDYVTRDDLPPAVIERFKAQNGRMRLEITPAETLDMQNEDQRRDFVEAVVDVAPRATGSALTVLRAGDIVALSMIQASVTAGAIVFVLLWVLLRNFVLVLLILFPIGLAAIFTSAAGVLLGQPYNFANVIVIPLLIGLGADSGIHLALRANKFVRHGTVFATTTPRAVLFSALTTIASFGTLALSDHRGTASMGALLTIAISFTLLCTLLVLPAAMDFLGRKRPI